MLVAIKKYSNAIELLQRNVEKYKNKEAVIFVKDPQIKTSAQVLCYGDLDRRAKQIASWLQQHFTLGQRVLLLYPTGLDFVSAFLGCLYAGMIAIPAPLPGKFSHQRSRLKAIAKNADISAVFTDSDNLCNVQQWIKDESVGDVFCIATNDNIELETVTWKMPSLQQQALALLQYTSGSTGDPKGVMISHGNLLHNVSDFAESLGLNENTRFGGWIPLFHDMGLMAQLLPALFMGSTCVLMSATAFLKRPQSWLQLIDCYNIHHSAAPNFAFDLCVRRITKEQVKELDLSRWQFLINGSEPILANSILCFTQHFKSAGFRPETVCPGYGMAEATVFVSCIGNREPVISFIDPFALEKNQFVLAEESKQNRSLVSCGWPVGLDIAIVDPQTFNPLANGQVGEIWLRGPSISSGYWRDQVSTINTFMGVMTNGEGGYLRTGDYGAIANGELYITGRIKEVIVVNGCNHYPQDIEQVIRHYCPLLCTKLGAVFSIAIPGMQEALVVTHEVAGMPSYQELEQIAKTIKSVILLEFGLKVSAIMLLPSGSVLRTTSGKIQRILMRENFLRNNLSPLFEQIHSSLMPLMKTMSDKLEALK